MQLWLYAIESYHNYLLIKLCHISIGLWRMIFALMSSHQVSKPIDVTDQIKFYHCRKVKLNYLG